MKVTNEKKEKKGILAAIWESMAKTGGCCGSGGDCCGSSSQDQTTGPDRQKKAASPETGCAS